jgi:hypothetical protein
MNPKLSYLLNVILSIGLFAAIFKSGCNPPPKGTVIKIMTDSNVVYDELEAHYFNQTEILTDSIEKLKQSLRTKKISYRNMPGKDFKDSIVTIQECCEMIPEANKIIESQDSVIRAQTYLISECGVYIRVRPKEVKKMNRNYFLPTQGEGLMAFDFSFFRASHFNSKILKFLSNFSNFLSNIVFCCSNCLFSRSSLSLVLY